MKPITSWTLSLIGCHWLFHRIFNPRINPGIPGLQNPNPEIPGLRSGPRIANTTSSTSQLCVASRQVLKENFFESVIL